MKYLLDVNALIALGFREHEFHERMSSWISGPSWSRLATCSITELGFIRVLANASPYNIGIDSAKAILEALRKGLEPRFEFVPDGIDAMSLPRWVLGPRQITDGHLLNVAISNGMQLATFDSRIPSAYLIP